MYVVIGRSSTGGAFVESTSTFGNVCQASSSAADSVVDVMQQSTCDGKIEIRKTSDSQPTQRTLVQSPIQANGSPQQVDESPHHDGLWLPGTVLVVAASSIINTRLLGVHQ